MVRTEIINILLENASSLKEKREILALSESDLYGVNNVMINNLYKSAVDKAHIDFEDIPKTKGDITKYSGYKPMVESITYMENLSKKNNIKIPELNVIDTAIRNIIAYRELFTNGYKLDKEFVILEYQTLVASCVTATSLVISSYVDFIKRVDMVDFTIINPKTDVGSLHIKSLEKFNKSVASGEFHKVMNTVIKTKQPVGEEYLAELAIPPAIVIPVAIIGGTILLVNVLRDLVYLFYNTRSKLSDHMKLMATFLEMNKANVEVNSSIPNEKRKKIIKKQADLAKTLRGLSEKIKVNDIMANNKAKMQKNDDNKAWKLDDVKADATNTQTGFQLL